MIYKTVGSGGDYSTLSSAINSLFYSSDPGDDIDFNLISSINDSLPSPAYIKFFNRKAYFHCTHNEETKDITQWYAINQQNANYCEFWANTYGFSMKFSHLRFNFLDISGTISRYMMGYLQGGTPTSERVYLTVMNCVFYGTLRNGVPTGHSILKTGSTGIISKFINNIISGTGIETALILSGDYTGTSNIIQNNNFIKCRNGLVKGSGSTWNNTSIKNTSFILNTVSDFPATGLTGCNIYNCADSDNSMSSCGGISLIP